MSKSKSHRKPGSNCVLLPVTGRRIHQTKVRHRQWPQKTCHSYNSIPSVRRWIFQTRNNSASQQHTQKTAHSNIVYIKNNEPKKWQDGTDSSPPCHKRKLVPSQGTRTQDTSHPVKQRHIHQPHMRRMGRHKTGLGTNHEQRYDPGNTYFCTRPKPRQQGH